MRGISYFWLRGIAVSSIKNELIQSFRSAVVVGNPISTQIHHLPLLMMPFYSLGNILSMSDYSFFDICNSYDIIVCAHISITSCIMGYPVIISDVEFMT